MHRMWRGAGAAGAAAAAHSNPKMSTDANLFRATQTSSNLLVFEEAK
jgi:hypothetical protein